MTLFLDFLILSFGAAANPLALRGHDPVTYFSGFPTMGKNKYAVDYRGNTYWFYSVENRGVFLNDPESYLPQFHGFCAASFEEGVERAANPKIYLLVDEKLFLFSSLEAMQDWAADAGF